jgi:UDP-N-acetylglucosamine 2-epimerase (non-hydrolysing)
MAAVLSISAPVRPAADRCAFHLTPTFAAAVALWPVAEALTGSGSPPAAPPLRPLTARELEDEVARMVAETRPSVALVASDEDDVVTCALVAVELGIPIAWIGAGRRSGDRTLGDEVNRVVLDGLAARLYVDDDEGYRALLDEGFPEARVRRFGSTVSSAVACWQEPARERALWRDLERRRGEYVFVRLRRDENVRDPGRLRRIVDVLVSLARSTEIVASIDAGADALRPLAEAGATVLGPIGYLDLLSLECGARSVLTDCGQAQEEATLLGVRCFTLRRASERPATLTYGTNSLLGDDPDEILRLEADRQVAPGAERPRHEGGAARRIAADLRAEGLA